MNTIGLVLSSHNVDILAKALLHSLWQGAFLAITAYILLKKIPSRLADLRYQVICGSLLCFVLFFIGTLSILEMPSALPASSSAIVQIKEDNIQKPILSPAVPIIVTSHFNQSSPTKAINSIFPRNWEGWLIVLWAAGVCLMVTRLFWFLFHDRLLIRRCNPVNNGEISSFVHALQDGMRITRKVLVLTGNTITSPAAMGILSPIVILPVSLITNMPIEHIQAILAHEMAHISRLDYLTNIFQMLVESFFFFNPAVWWINKQIRIEREACCDAMAIHYCGDASKYMHALSSAVEIQEQPFLQPQTAWNGNMDKHHLLDRVLRIARPSYLPKQKITWSGLLGCVVIAGLLIACMKEGTDFAAGAVNKWFLTEKQVEEISKITREFNHMPKMDRHTGKPVDQLEKYAISGIIKPPTGETLPKGLVITAECLGPISGSTGTSCSTNTFSFKVYPGQYKITCRSRQTAYYESTDFIEAVTEDISNIVIQLETGYPSKIQIVDTENNPISGAKVSIAPIFKNANGTRISSPDVFITDSNGTVTYPHTSHYTYSIKVEKPGYQLIERDTDILKKDKTSVLTAKKSNPVSGIVIDKKTQKPIPDANIYILEKKTYNRSCNYGESNFFCSTEKTGTFNIDTIEDDAVCSILADATGYHPFVLSRVSAGQQNCIIELGPAITIKGYAYPISAPKNTLMSITYGNLYSGIENYERIIHYYAPLRIEGDKGFFELTKIWPGKVQIFFPDIESHNEIKKTFDITESLSDLAINLSDSAENTINTPTREVIIHFEIKNNTASPKGKIKVGIFKLGTEENSYQYVDSKYPVLQNNTAKIIVNPPCYIESSPFELTGGWFENKAMSPRITAGSEPYEATVTVIPAGIIYGTVIGENGKPKVAKIEFQLIEPTPITKNTFMRYENPEFQSSFSYSLPLGGKYRITASDKNYVLESQEIVLTQQNPSKELIFQFKPGISIQGKIKDENGYPVRGIGISLSYKRDNNNKIFLSNFQNENNGEFAIADIDPDVKDKYSLFIDGNKSYLPIEYCFSPSQKEITITLIKGKIAEGYIFDSETNQPIPGVQVSAEPVKYDKVEYSPIQAEQFTDKNGKFRFSNLKAKEYNLKVQTHNSNAFYDKVFGSITGGQIEPVTVYARLREPLH